MINFDFLKKSLGLVSPPHLLHDSSKKIFLMLYSINWSNFIFWFSSLLEIIWQCVCCNCFYSVFDAINFEIYHSFLIKPVFYMSKKLRTKIEISQEYNDLSRWNKTYFKTSVARNCLRPESVPLSKKKKDLFLTVVT